MTDISDEDKFEYWLMDMDQALDRFISSLPSGEAEKLDFSPESLTILELCLLNKYQNVEDTKPAEEAAFVDGATRYVGETFRKALGGKWSIELNDKNNVFFGVPQLIGFKGQKSQLCPQKLVIASLDRRTGKFIGTLLNNHLRKL